MFNRGSVGDRKREYVGVGRERVQGFKMVQTRLMALVQ
jgi:hypothetical protein